VCTEFGKRYLIRKGEDFNLGEQLAAGS
jgi:hypothetical protein